MCVSVFGNDEAVIIPRPRGTQTDGNLSHEGPGYINKEQAVVVATYVHLGLRIRA
jgi:hypothetical protein